MAIYRTRKLSDESQGENGQQNRTLVERVSYGMVELSMWCVLLVFLPLLGWRHVKRVGPNRALVKHRLGKAPTVAYSGYNVVLPAIDSAVEVSLAEKSIVIPSAQHVTLDKVIMQAGVVVGYRITDPLTCVRETQDVDDSVTLASRTALPAVLSQSTSAMIQCSVKLIEYAVVKKINNAVCLWGVEVVSAELKPLSFSKPSSSSSSSSSSNDPASIFVNLINKLAGNNPLPAREEFSMSSLIDSLQPYLTLSIGERVDAVVLLDLEGARGGRCLIDFRTCSMVADPSTCHPDVTLHMTVETLHAMVEERESVVQFVRDGKIRITGDMDVARRLQAFF